MKNRFIYLTFLLAILIVFVFSTSKSFTNTTQAVNDTNSDNKTSTTSSELQKKQSNPKDSLLQFTGDNHIIGFKNDGVIFATGDHALNVKFVNPLSTSPVSEGDNNTSTTSKKALPLQKVTYKEVWKNIDLTYTSNKGSIAESTYYLNPLQDGTVPVDSIRLKYNRPVSLDKQGNLVISFDKGTMTETAPISWQVIDGVKKPVVSKFVIDKNNEVGFSLGEYIPGVQVVIDPSIIWESQNPGGRNIEDMVLDSAGNTYLTGMSSATWGTPINPFNGTLLNTFVAKLDTNGNLVWNTFMGGNGLDEGYSITIDSGGNVYIAGRVNGGWGSPIRPYTPGSGSNAFVVKLNSSGALLWNTFLGSSYDYGMDIAVDVSGNIYVGGMSQSSWGSPIEAFHGFYDGFIAKLDSSGNLLWNTFVGTTGIDYIYALKLDPSGNIYIAGASPVTWGTPINPFVGGTEGFIAKFTNAGALTWNTFFGNGGASVETYPYSLKLDSGGNIYISGKSNASWGSPTISYKGPSLTAYDAFVAKFTNAGALTWNAFLGAYGYQDYGGDVDVDSSGNVYVAGQSQGGNWGSPITPIYNNDYSIFAAKLTSIGNLVWNTFLQGSYYGDIAVGASGVRLSGDGFVANLPLLAPQVLPTFSPVNGTAVAPNTYITITSSGATSIYYTTNGTDPTTGSASVASGGNVLVSPPMTLKALAVKSGIPDSDIASASYVQTPQPPPTFSPVSGSAIGYGITPIAITSSGATAIYYTVDGSPPTTGSTLYTVPITINSSTIKAIAVRTGYANSAVSTAIYSQAVQTTPTFSPVAGAIAFGTSVTITSSGATNIYYTTDGSTPTTGSSVYSIPVVVNSAQTIKALAVRTGYANSAVGSAVYTQAATANLASLVLSGPPTGYTFASATYSYPSVTTANATSSITVTPTGTGMITVNGDAVTTGTPSLPISLTAGTPSFITVIATETGKTSKTYTISVTRNNPAPAVPTFNPTAGPIAFGSTVSLSTDAGATIYYTTNGTTPTTASTVYSSPITISASTTIKAIAARTGYDTSAVASASYPQATVADLDAVTLSGTPSGFTFSGSTYNYASVIVPNNQTGIVVGVTGTGVLKVNGETVSSGGTSSSTALVLGTPKTITITATETGKIVKTYTITVRRELSTPTFTPNSGPVTFGVTTITLASDVGTTIYYTTNGADPLLGGSLSVATGGTITLSSVTNPIKAYAGKSGFASSSLATSGVYLQASSTNLTNIAMSGSPVGYAYSVGAYVYTGVSVANSVSSVTITPTGAGTITVNGTTVASGVASGAIVLVAGTPNTITIVNTETGKTAKTYTITVTRNYSAQTTPTFSPTAGPVAFGSTVSISSTNADNIYYTTDNSPPTIASSVYSTPVTISASTTIKALAVRAGYDNSAIASASYPQATTTNLTNIVLSGTPSGFTFSSGTYSYTGITVPYSQSGLEITPTGAGVLVVNGETVASGGHSSSTALVSGVSKTITIIATETGKIPKVYTITVTRTVAPKAFTSFGFTSPLATGVVTESNHTISVAVPSGTSLVSLVPTFTTTGIYTTVAGDAQTSGITSQNFSGNVTYRVFGDDGYFQDYVVTVTINDSFVISPISGPTAGGTSFSISGSGIVFSTTTDQYTKLLLHADGTGNSFTDASSTPKAITAYGNITQSTTRSKFGGKSAYFSGSGDYLTTPDNDDWSFGSGNFTIDTWGYFANSMGAVGTIAGSGGGGANWTASGHEWTLFLYTDSKLYFQYNQSLVGYSVISTSAVNVSNGWHHFAVVRNGTTITLYVDGTSVGSGSLTGAITHITGGTPKLVVGNIASIGADNWKGYLDEFRISKGIARWSSNFTPPTLPYSIPNVTLGGVSASNIKVLDSASLTASTSAHSAGLIDVVITNSAGTIGTSTGAFTYLAPTISSISPNFGPASGGTSVTITGDNFSTDAVRVEAGIGGAVTVSNGYVYHTFSSSGTFAVPSNREVEVYAWGAGGAGGTVGGWLYGAAGGAGGFAFGKINANANTAYAVTVGGGGAVNAATGAVGGGGAATNNSTDNRYSGGGGGYSGIFTTSASQANALLIAGGGGGGGSSRAGTGNAGGAGGGAVGQAGFSPYDGKTAYGGNPGTQSAAGTNASCDPTITGGGGQGALQGGVTRSNSYGGGGGGGYWGGSAGGYSESNTMAGGGGGSGYFNPTLVRSAVLTAGSGITPGNSSEPLRGNSGNAGVVAGAGSSGLVVVRYPAILKLEIGGVSVRNINIIDSNTIIASTSARTAGLVDVVITSVLDGEIATSTNAFTYIAPPSVYSVTPSSVTNLGGDSLTITGADFVDGATVSFGGLSTTTATYINPTTLTVMAPSHPVGSVDIVVTTPDGQSGVLIGGLTYTYPAPTISSVSPNSGYSSGGTSVTITGSNFISVQEALDNELIASGGTVTTVGNYVVHTFTSSGTFVSHVNNLKVEYLVVAGGGGGGVGYSGGYGGGGGGAGGFLTGSTNVNVGNINVVVGNGGTVGGGCSSGGSGGVSSFSTVSAVGGGGGATVCAATAVSGIAGGSGGGGRGAGSSGGTGVSGQGYAGGAGASTGNGGGGGGAGGVGGGVGSNNGGAGLPSSISGVSTYYAGGGGGSGNVSYCAGGVGGGGGRNIAAVANTGGGGAGQWSQTGSGVNGNASAGGSGIVIVRYLVPSVIIGGVPAQNVNIVNSTTITASTSAHTVGLVDVTVVNPDQQAATSTNAFRYNDGIDNSTVLLLHANYTGSTFVDSSGTNKIVTAVGNTTQSVTQSKFGGKSAYFDGAGDYLSVADSEDFDFGSGDFTIDWWEYRTSATAGKASIQRLNTAAGVNPFLAGYSDGTNLYFYASSNGSSWDVASAKSMGPVSLNQWVHLAVVRSGNNFYTFKNGVQQGTPLSSSLSLQNVAGPLETGRYYGSYYLDGYIDDMRIAKGVARWTNDFTPAGFQFVQTNPIITIIGSTTASVLVDNVYTDAGAIATDDTDGDITSSIIINNLVKTTASTTFSVTYDVTNSLGNHTQATRTVLVAPSTVLLLHADASGNTFVDSSGTNKIVTANGNVTQVDRIQKFGGKSAYFDGGGDYLSIPTSSDFDFGNGNFTIDFWYYKSGTPETSARLFQTRTGDIYSGVSFYHNGANNLVLGLDTTGATPWELTSSNITIADNTWTHFAIVRNSTNIQVYKNGVSVYSTTLSGSLYYNPTDIIVIGGQSTPSRSINGYLDEFRVTKGIARWTSNFNPLIHAYGTSRILNIGSQPQIRKTIINNSSSGKLKIIKN